MRGYKEEGTTTTPFDMVMLNDLDRFHLVVDVIDRVPGARRARGVAATGDARPPPALPRLDARVRRGPPGRARLGLAVLVVNAGSTSLKLHVVEGDESHEVDSLEQDVGAVAHRVVHGGARFREPVLIDEEVRREIHELEALAPLHNAPAVRAIAQAQRALPDVPHVAVFDTAFHATIPDEAATYALPQTLARPGAFAATASTACRCSGAPSRCACRGSSSATSAAAARSQPCATVAPSTRRWASARWRACR